MLKKFYLAFALFIVIMGCLFLFVTDGANRANDNLCPFCDPLIIERQKFYEDDLVIALVTHKPILPGHILIIPKNHTERLEFLSDDEVLHVYKTIQKVHKVVSKVFGTSSYLILQKNGIEAGQTVPHVHFHYIPRKTGDTSSLKFLFHFYISSFKRPLNEDEMKPIIEKLKFAISEFSDSNK